MRSYKNKVLVCFLSIVFYVPCGYARCAVDEESLVKKMHKKYCTFSGILDSKKGVKVGDRWDEEFRMLEEKQDRPNFKAMRNTLADIITLPNDLVKNCPSLQAYLLALVNYVNSRSNNKNITENLRGIIGYISQHQLADDVLYEHALTENQKQGDQTAGMSTIEERERRMEELDKKLKDSGDYSREPNYVQMAIPVDEGNYTYNDNDEEFNCA